jgi:hypothetical protein
MVAMSSWQDENSGAEVGERERQHIHPPAPVPKRFQMEGFAVSNTRNHHAASAQASPR